MNQITNFSYGESKVKNLLKGFVEGDTEQLEKGGKLNTSHLVLKEVMVNGKTAHRWVDPNTGQEHAEHGSKVELEHKGQRVTGTVGSVQKTGEYSIKLDKEHGGHSINKHPHQFESPHGGNSKLQEFAGKASESGLQNTLKSKEATPEMKEIAQKELEQRNGGKFGGLKSLLQKKKQEQTGIDLSDPETKEIYDHLSTMAVPDLHDLSEEKGIAEHEREILEHVIKEKTKTTAEERIQRYKDKLNYVMKTPHAHLFTYGKGGIGKAMPLYSKILTPTGWKTMGEMTIGQEVLTPKGTVSKVIGVFPQVGNRPIHEITLIDGSKCRADLEHLWKVVERSGDYGEKIISTKDMIEKGLRTNRQDPSRREWRYATVMPIDVYQSEDVELPIKPWLLGYLLGDGCLTSHVGFSCGERDIEFILDKINSSIEEGYEVVQYDNEINEYHIIKKTPNVAVSNKYITILKELGLFGHKSIEKFIPELYMNASSRQKLELIQGLMDADGYIKEDGSAEFAVSSKKLAEDFRTLVKSFGCFASFKYVKSKYYTHNGEKKLGNEAWSVSFELQSKYIPVTLPYKTERYKNKKFYRNGLSIVDISYVGEEPAQCIMIEDEDHLYITDDYIVTHNTFNIKEAIKKRYGKNREFDGQKMSYGSGDYDAAFLGKVTPADLYKQLYLHNGKTIVFDDADDILKDPVAVNMFKRAMDTSDSKLNWDSGGKLEKPDPVTGEIITIPRDFKFDGKIIFISNKPKKFFTESEDKKALLSRGDSMELQFSNKETHDLLNKQILPQSFKGKTEWKVLKDKVPANYDDEGNFESYKTDTPEFKEFTEQLKDVSKLLEKHASEIPEGELNGRTIQKLYGVYSHALETNKELEEGEKPRDPEKEVLASLRGSLSKALLDEQFEKALNYMLGVTESEDILEIAKEIHDKYKDKDEKDLSTKQKNEIYAGKTHTKMYDRKSGKVQKSIDVELQKSYIDDLEKGHKDVTHLEKKIIINKNGQKQTVYVRHHDNGDKHEFSQGHNVKFEHKGKNVSGTIKGLKHNENTDKYGTAIIYDGSGNKYEKSLRAIDHSGKGVLEDKTSKVKTEDIKVNGVSSLPNGVLGKTRSGKNVYENNKKADHKSYRDFTMEDHEDAIKFHKQKSKEYSDMFNNQPEIIRKNSGSKGYRIHPLDSKRNTHAQRAFEHEMAMSALKKQEKKTANNSEDFESKNTKPSEQVKVEQVLSKLQSQDKPDKWDGGDCGTLVLTVSKALKGVRVFYGGESDDHLYWSVDGKNFYDGKGTPEHPKTPIEVVPYKVDNKHTDYHFKGTDEKISKNQVGVMAVVDEGLLKHLTGTSAKPSQINTNYGKIDLGKQIKPKHGKDLEKGSVVIMKDKDGIVKYTGIVNGIQRGYEKSDNPLLDILVLKEYGNDKTELEIDGRWASQMLHGSDYNKKSRNNLDTFNFAPTESTKKMLSDHVSGKLMTVRQKAEKAKTPQEFDSIVGKGASEYRSSIYKQLRDAERQSLSAKYGKDAGMNFDYRDNEHEYNHIALERTMDKYKKS